MLFFPLNFFQPILLPLKFTQISIFQPYRKLRFKISIIFSTSKLSTIVTHRPVHGVKIRLSRVHNIWDELTSTLRTTYDMAYLLRPLTQYLVMKILWNFDKKLVKYWHCTTTPNRVNFSKHWGQLFSELAVKRLWLCQPCAISGN